VKRGTLSFRLTLAGVMLNVCAAFGIGVLAQTTRSTAILPRDVAASLMPSTVFFRGQSASVQARNSAGLRLDGGQLVLVAAVDTSGYSSGIAQKYQAYLLTEVPLNYEDHTLAPGAYGIGFVDTDSFIIMDIGGNELLHARSVHDQKIVRPNPLQITNELDAPGHYRLYMGRCYVSFAPIVSPNR
jgi:hypothetical protein